MNIEIVILSHYYIISHINKIWVATVVPRTFTILFAERMSTSKRLVFGFYFLIDQGVVRLALRVLGPVKTILLKSLLFAFVRKFLDNKMIVFIEVLHKFYYEVTSVIGYIR
jgi:hypothetical protein